MKSSLNTIRKQTIQFQYNGNADGFALQKEVSDWCNLTLIPEIEQQLDSFDLGENYFSIDKLEIEASVNSNDWKQKISNELIFSLKQKLSNYKPILKESNEKVVTRSGKLDELILFYFENGYLPWWGKALLNDDFATILKNWIGEEMSLSRAEYVSEQLKQIVSKNVIERILNQVPRQHYFQLLKTIYKVESEVINQIESFFKEEIATKISVAEEKAISNSVFSFLFKMMIENGGKIDTHWVLHFLYEELKEIEKSARILKPKSSKTEKSSNPIKKIWQELLIKDLNEQEREKERETSSAKEQKQEEIEIEKIVRKKELQYHKLIDKLINPDLKGNSKNDSIAELQEGIYIDNAGVVIFAAFIPALFKKLDLEKDGVILNPDLAVLIIQYCVTGNVNIAEYELVLPKILCGIEIEYPVITNTKISTEQMNEVDEMLLSVIEYWSAIKNTSIEGLRESFLKRSGKLSLVNNEWLLLVDQKPYDMLLERLPWSITMIKLLWMENLLKTEWV